MNNNIETPYEVDSVNLFQKNAIPPGQEKLTSFAYATVFKGKGLDNVRIFLEAKLGLLGEQKLQFLQEVGLTRRVGFKGDRWSALRLCRKACWIVISTNMTIVAKRALNL